MNSNITRIAAAYNFLRAINSLYYGTKEDFIKSKMESCLNDSIISAECANNKFWVNRQIEVVESGPVEMKNPHRALKYSLDGSEPAEEPKQYWRLDFKKVLLPDGWYMTKGCSCGRNFSPDTFCVIDNNNGIVETLKYFSDYRVDEEKSGLERFCDDMDDVDDVMDNLDDKL